MTAEEAFGAYEAVRHRLPEARQAGRAIERVASLADIADRFETFLLDAFGVLNIGDSAIPGTRDRIDALRAAGKRVAVVSNAASVPASELAGKYRRLGYDFPVEDIITSRSAMAAGLAGRAHLHWGAMSLPDSRLDDLGDLRVTRLAADHAAYEVVEGFLLIGSGAWGEDEQHLLEAALRRQPRPVLVANPDIVAPREYGFSIEPGSFAHRLADATGVVPDFYGKPFHNIYDLAFARLGVSDRSRVVMVGDSLHTDILGAHAAGIASALVVKFGFLSGMDAEAAMRSAQIYPDVIVERP